MFIFRLFPPGFFPCPPFSFPRTPYLYPPVPYLPLKLSPHTLPRARRGERAHGIVFRCLEKLRSEARPKRKGYCISFNSCEIFSQAGLQNTTAKKANAIVSRLPSAAGLVLCLTDAANLLNLSSHNGLKHVVAAFGVHHPEHRMGFTQMI